MGLHRNARLGLAGRRLLVAEFPTIKEGAAHGAQAGDECWRSPMLAIGGDPLEPGLAPHRLEPGLNGSEVSTAACRPC